MNALNLIVPPPATLQRVWEFDHLSYRVGSRVIIDSVSVDVVSGETTCLCGANGAGKTFLVRCGLGLIGDYGGHVKLFGKDPALTRFAVGYVPQYKAFNRAFAVTVGEFIGSAVERTWPLILRRSLQTHVLEALASVDAESLFARSIHALSVGELQRVFLARALITKPKLLVLDEPFAGVDEAGRLRLLTLLRQLKASGLTIVLITHSKQVAVDVADRLIFLFQGRLLAWDKPVHVFDGHNATISSGFICHDHEHAIENVED